MEGRTSATAESAGRPSPNPKFFGGEITEVTVDDRALTREEVTALVPYLESKYNTTII